MLSFQAGECTTTGPLKVVAPVPVEFETSLCDATCREGDTLKLKVWIIFFSLQRQEKLLMLESNAWCYERETYLNNLNNSDVWNESKFISVEPSLDFGILRHFLWLRHHQNIPFSGRTPRWADSCRFVVR